MGRIHTSEAIKIKNSDKMNEYQLMIAKALAKHDMFDGQTPEDIDFFSSREMWKLEDYMERSDRWAECDGGFTTGTIIYMRDPSIIRRRATIRRTVPLKKVEQVNPPKRRPLLNIVALPPVTLSTIVALPSGTIVRKRRPRPKGIVRETVDVVGMIAKELPELFRRLKCILLTGDTLEDRDAKRDEGIRNMKLEIEKLESKEDKTITDYQLIEIYKISLQNTLDYYSKR
jgi:hypothetical protein